MDKKRFKRLEVFFEFLIFGVIMGVVEDLIAIKLTTDAEFTPRVVLIVTLVAIPFAIIGEILVDKKEWFMKTKKKIGEEIHKPHSKKQ